MNALHYFFPRPYADSSSVWQRIKHVLAKCIINLHPATSGCAPCRQNIIPPLKERTCHFIQPSFPIDIVYTWVNGADPVHRAKRQSYLPLQKNIHNNGLELARFRDNEELRYSLRAVDAFAPWVRRILIVTDNQTPVWLNTAHEKIRIVDHSEFIPSTYLPTFNSHVIEAFLHNIPNLAEHYIYLNDDVFLARPTQKTDFFTSNGLPIAFVDWRKRRIFGYKQTLTPHATSYFNTLKLLEKHHIKTETRFVTAHGPYPQKRSYASEAFDFYKDLIMEFAHNKFRTTEEVALYSHALPLWMYPQKLLVPCDERYYYVQTKRRDRLAYYSAILDSKEDSAPPLFFCINDVGNNAKSDLWQHDMHKLMQTYFPVPSSFEIAIPQPSI